MRSPTDPISAGVVTRLTASDPRSSPKASMPSSLGGVNLGSRARGFAPRRWTLRPRSARRLLAGLDQLREVVGELAQHRVADVFHDPSAELGRLAGDVHVGEHVDVGDAVVLVQGGGDRGVGAAVALGVTALGLQHDPFGCLVLLDEPPSPLNVIEMGPSLIFIPPSKASPSTEVTAAPGRHGAIFSTSISSVHARRRGRGR